MFSSPYIPVFLVVVVEEYGHEEYSCLPVWLIVCSSYGSSEWVSDGLPSSTAKGAQSQGKQESYLILSGLRMFDKRQQ